MNFRDVELLSEYLDGRLNPSDTRRLEARLQTDLSLKATLEDLRQTRGLLRRLPQRGAPRSFRLTPKMVGVRPPEPRAYPAFRFATVLAAFLFVTAVALNAFTPLASRHLAAAPAPAFGMGGGGGGGPIGGGADPTMEAAILQGTASAEAPAATEAAPLAPFAALAPTATPEGTEAGGTSTPAVAGAAPQAQDTSRATNSEATELANKAVPVQPPAQTAPVAQQPVPVGWIIALGVTMLVCAAAAWVLRTSNDRRIRDQWNRK